MRKIGVLNVYLILNGFGILFFFPIAWFGHRSAVLLFASQLPLLLLIPLILTYVIFVKKSINKVLLATLCAAIFSAFILIPARVLNVEIVNGKLLVVKAHRIQYACNAYASDHAGSFPASLAELIKGGYLASTDLRCPLSSRKEGANTDSDFIFVGGGITADIVKKNSHKLLIAYTKVLFLRDKRLLVFADQSDTRVGSTLDLDTVLENSLKISGK